MEIDNTKQVFSLDTRANQIMKRLHRLLQRKVHCDVEIVIGKQSFPVHKIVMISSSGFFENLTWENDNDCDKDLTKVTLNNVDGEALHWVIHFCYTGEIELKESNVEKVLDVAGYLQVDDLVDLCFGYFYSYINESNCLKIAELAYLYNRTDIWENAFTYCCDNFSKIIKKESFLQINFDLLLKLLESNEIDVASEEDIFRSVKRWVDFDSYVRSKYISTFIKKIRLQVLNKSFLSSEVKRFCENNIECEKSVDNAISVKFSEQVLVSNTRKCLIKALVVGGRSSSMAATLEEYNHCTNTWKVIFEIPLFRNTVEFAAVVVGNDLILIGGYVDKPVSRVIKVNTRNGDVETLAPLIRKRSELRTVQLNGLIYAIGGYDGTEQINLMEIYDIERNFWSNGVSMNTKRAAFAIAALNNNIYVAGGHSIDVVASNTMEVYSIEKKKWSFCAPMPKNKNYVEMIAFGEYLYAFGGCDTAIRNSNIQCYTDIDRYDPVNDSWTTVANFTTGRACVGACPLKNDIFIIGGIDERKSVLSEVYLFNPKDNKLRQMVNANIPRQNPRALSYVRI